MIGNVKMKPLTKSLYMNGQQCPRLLWFGLLKNLRNCKRNREISASPVAPPNF